ncbi:integrator complex subunit 1-like [Tropilaelaps mercedesae]|uniref:Integrator complex subunit 1-like n=1 Tax=Tropilaelaps mercedesae TaxID=418985 RepID=A0A1V9XCV1_9ACAR|nr:integrator complex subunit 1-like [Tropilaelaps mercedesae]
MDRDKKSSLLKTRALPSGSKGKPMFNSTELIMLGPKQSDKSSGKVVKRDLMGGARREPWETKVVNVEPEMLMSKFAAAEKDGDEDRMQGVLCGAVKLLRMQRPKPDAVLYLSLMFLAKTRPQSFQNDVVVEAFCHLLRKETPPPPALKVKGASAVAILAANLLLAVYQDSDQWPEAFVRVFVDDSLAERLWVDHEECKCFVDNILTAFKTRLPPKSMMAPELTFKSEACPSPPATSGAIATDDDDSLSSLHLDLKETTMSMSVVPRYGAQEERIEKYILDVIQEQLQRRQPTDISRNVLKLMVCACGLSAVRALVAHRLETWLSNPKLTRPAQDLLLTTCMNCNQHNKHDQDVIEYLVRIRLKTKPVINHFLQCVRELLGLHPDNLPSMLRRTIFNELSQSRNPNNMGLISVILQHSPERAARVLAEIFQDLLASREDYLRALRALFREIIRSLRHELNFHSFCSGLMTERKEPHIVGLEQLLKERLLMQVADLITLATFMAITPAVKECATALYRGEKKDLTPLYHFQQQISAIQCDVVGWMHMTVMRMYRPNYQDFMLVLRKCLFLLDQPEQFCRDNWPPEQERGLYLRISSEMPVMEDTLLRVLFIGMSKEHPAMTTDAVELVDALVRRAGAVPGGGSVENGVGRPVLQVEQLELFDIVFSLCAYHQPDTYALPEGYTPPSLAIADYYWRAFLMMLVVIAHNPATCGRKAWAEYPTLRAMMHMCITNSFVFPPAASADQSEEMRATEMQIAMQEKQCILEFETHLAAASTKVTITEQNSLLLSKLIMMHPVGPARRPPPPVLEQLKSLNEKLRLGQLLCRSRNPNYLLEIIRDQQESSSQSMPWLADLVESSEGSLDILPVQCLCEFLLSDALEMGSEAQRQRMMPNKRRKLQQLMGHLHRLLREPDSDRTAAREVIEYFMKRLTSQHMSPRSLAVRALQLLLCPTNNNGGPGGQQEGGDFDWLLEQIPQLPHFSYLLEQVIYTLRSAIHIETDPLAVVAYVAFLSLHTPEDQQADVCLDLAHLLVERSTIMNAILPQDNSTTFVYGDLFLVSLLDLFLAYLNLARRSPHVAWQDEFVQVEWSSGEHAQMHILVVHSMIIALTYGPPRERPERFAQLLRVWFPPDGVTIQAFLAGTREEALLLPDWLKLRMIRSPVEPLVDAALRDLTADQLVLFIQSFGIPVASMSKLLHYLDRAVELEPHSLSNAMLDKSYMSQLVEVQHRRGAVGGDRYKQLLAVDKDPEPMETDSGKPTSVIQMAPRNSWPRIGQQEVAFHSVTDAIVRIYRLEPNQPNINSKIEQDLYRRLQKLFAEDIGKPTLFGGPVAEFICSCARILEDAQSAQLFSAQLQSKAAMSCSLFKLAMTATRDEPANSPLALKLAGVCGRLFELAVEAGHGDQPSPLLEMFKQFVASRSAGRKPMGVRPSQRSSDLQLLDEQRPETAPPASVAEMIDSLTSIAASQPDRLEEALCTLVQRAIRSGDSSRLCQAVTQILADERLSPKGADQVNTSFVLVDWFEQLEPECVWSDKAAQLKLLFEKHSNGSLASSRFRLYLLSVLIHRAHWRTLLECIAMLLVRPIDQSLDPSAVLDFLSACMFIPKIWQGRDKKLPKHHSVENVLALTTDQMCAVADFMLDEMLSQDNDNDDDDDDDNEKVKKAVARRMHIIEHSCVKQAYSTHLADHLVTIFAENSRRSRPAKMLLVKLYLSMPSVIFSADSVNYLLSDISPQKGGHTRVDCLSHSILIAMSVCDTDKTFKSDLRYLNLSCRKLAATHPDLLLRQLPLIASLLHSRMSAGIPMFGTKNNRKSLLVCIIGVLELLRQKLFNQEYVADVNTILSVYLESMLLHVNAGMTRAVEDNIGGNLNRLLGLANAYVKYNPDAAREFLAEHQEQLEELARTYKNMASLRSLLKGGALIADEKSGGGGGGGGPGGTPSLIMDSPLPSDELMNKIPINLADRDATLQGLQKLEMTASRRPAILELYQDELQSLLSAGDSQLCKQAFRLMLLCIEQRPAAAGRFVSCYLQCLASERRDVVAMALEKLPEFVVLCEEHAPLLLHKAFQLGISSNVNSVEPISDALELLNMQYGN